MNAIFSVSQNWGLGKNGELLARIPEDMKRFRALTLGKTVVMGRKTLESLPGGNPLPGRENVVLSRKGIEKEGVISFSSIPEALDYLSKKPREDVFVIGGAEIYKAFLPFTDTLYVTHIEKEFDADAFFPDISADGSWELISKEEKKEYNGLDYYFAVYGKKECV